MPDTTHSDQPKSRPASRLAGLAAEPTAALFVYGSLLFPEVLHTLLDRVPPSTPASAAGWRVAALHGRVYPALVPAEDIAQGLLLTGLSHVEWRTLDSFEDGIYGLRRLALSDSRHGWAYVTDEHPEVLASNWDPDMFSRDALAAYIERCRQWRQRYEQA